MTRFIACLLMLLSSSAYAQTQVPLQVPAPSSYDGANYFGRPVNFTNRNDIVVTGFSLDGNYVNASVRGWVAVGHSGRGSNLHYFYWCGSFTFDLGGNLVGETMTATNSYGTYLYCARPNPSAVYVNSGGYTAYSTPVVANYVGIVGYTPELTAP